MSFFSKLNNKQTNKFIEGDNSFSLEIIKESHYQQHLKKICGGYTKEGNEHSEVASLHYASKQSDDKNAIRVVMRNKTVGYLSPEDSKRYRKRLKRLKQEGIIIECNAKICGGTKLSMFNKTSFEIWLDLSIENFTVENVHSHKKEEVHEEKTLKTEPIEVESSPKVKPISPIEL